MKTNDVVTACFGNDVSVAEALREMSELRLRHSIVSIPQRPEEIGTSAKNLVLAECAEGPPTDEMVQRRFKVLGMKDVICAVVRGGAATCAENILKTLNTYCFEIANISQTNNYTPLWSDASLVEVARAFKDHPRVPIFHWDPATRSVTYLRLFSATDFFQLLSDSWHKGGTEDISPEFAEQIQATMDATTLEAYAKPVLSISEDEPLSRVLEKLGRGKFSAMPVVDNLLPIGIISTTDFRSLFLSPHLFLEEAAVAPPGAEVYGKILGEQTAASYVAKLKQMECLKARFPTISARPTSSLLQSVNKLVGANIHRLFIVDDEGQLLGLFSRTDFGRILADVYVRTRVR